MLDHFKKSFLFANKMVANKIPPHSCAASPVFFGAWRLVSVMVHWWFRFVVWIPGIPERERDCYELAYPNSNPKPPVPKPLAELVFRGWILRVGIFQLRKHQGVSDGGHFGSASLFPILYHESRVGPPEFDVQRKSWNPFLFYIRISWICLLGWCSNSITFVMGFTMSQAHSSLFLHFLQISTGLYQY